MTDHVTLRRLAEAATPGPWHDKTHCTVNSGAPLFEVVADTEMDHARTVENASYIAAAHPAAILALLDEVERLRVTQADALHVAYSQGVADGRDVERERCAKVCDELDSGNATGRDDGAAICAAAIRGGAP